MDDEISAPPRISRILQTCVKKRREKKAHVVYGGEEMKSVIDD